MNKHEWNAERKRQFIVDLKALCDTYGLQSIDVSAGYYNKQFYIGGLNCWIWPTKVVDERDADEAIRASLIEQSLQHGDKDAFIRLTSGAPIHSERSNLDEADKPNLCATCDAKVMKPTLTCKVCGSPLCGTCHALDNGICSVCSDKHFRLR